MNKLLITGAAVGALIIGTACAKSQNDDSRVKASESGVVTNDNGSVSRSYTERTITTNGNMVTEHRRETRTTLDTEGNLLESSTSEYAQSYPVGDEGFAPSLGSTAGGITPALPKTPASTSASTPSDTFLSLKFGDKFEGTNLVTDVEEPTLLRASFIPKKTLTGFDDYYVYVTPTTHRVAKIYACAKDAVEPGARWRRHYLIEALEKKYHTWARLASYWKPLYAFDLEGSRELRICLAGANSKYETIIVAWDKDVLADAILETEAIREEARKAAVEKRNSRVKDAADAF